MLGCHRCHVNPVHRLVSDKFVGKVKLQVLVCVLEFAQVGFERLIVVEDQLAEFLKRQIGVLVELLGVGVQGSCLVKRGSDSNLVQAEEEVFDGQVAFVVFVPLVEDALKVRSRGVLAAEGSSDVLKVM